MNKRIGQVILECVVDLGITIVYASLVGLMIVAIVASDDDQVSLMSLMLYASLLPAGVFLLILIDAVARIVSERRRPDRSKRTVPKIQGVARTCFNASRS